MAPTESTDGTTATVGCPHSELEAQPETEFDLSDPAFITDPAAGERWLSAPRPICRGRFADGMPIWVVTRYADVKAVLSDPRFASKPPGDLHVQSMLARGIPEDIVEMFDSTVLTMDGPDHARVRRLVTGALSARRVRSLRSGIERIATELLDKMDPGGEVDLIAELAHPLAIAVICELLGVDERYREQWRQWSETLAAALRPDPEQLAPAVRGMAAVTRELIEARRAHPEDDLISELVGVHEADGDRLTDDELVAMAMVLVQAGHDTVRNLICLGVHTLLDHPEQAELLRAEPDRTARAVAELVRYTAPVKHTFRRFATEPVRLGEITVAQGEAVQIVLAAANRDPEQFTEPGELDLARPDNPHLGFGHGPHYCLGAALALNEAEIAINLLLRRHPGLRRAAPAEEVAPRYLLPMEKLPVYLEETR
ncbi:cytochrome P450 family protein [Amycolatopsis cihanbeyliensis]|uniref:Cytochrome P450 n=1 Tax=Amycolatopsis cihanbeyliensis TaxID=1128664 RepID=A0A542DJD8_AMYCI|nr:cytochrome P450 [Amycolatopsis cihanbeyliensis]TQJ03203.1 cytochrome P450 [Amycolatopsis cihanbeyliensis]WCB87236.1 EfrOI [Amycolatopsis cihanbeyliensis]